MPGDGIGGTVYSMEDLSAYLDRGREPRIAEIEANAECQAILASLSRMGALSRKLVEAEAQTALDEGWLQGILREVAREVRAGRDIPIPSDDATRLVITEGALRGLVREIGDALPGVIVERTRIVEGAAPDARDLRVEVVVSVAFGRPVHAAAEDVRRVTTRALSHHTGLDVAAVDVTVDSIHGDGGGAQR